MTDPSNDLPVDPAAQTPTEVLLAAVNHALTTGGHMTNANLAFSYLLDRLGTTRDQLPAFDPRWSLQEPVRDTMVISLASSACEWGPMTQAEADAMVARGAAREVPIHYGTYRLRSSTPAQ